MISKEARSPWWEESQVFNYEPRDGCVSQGVRKPSNLTTGKWDYEAKPPGNGPGTQLYDVQKWKQIFKCLKIRRIHRNSKPRETSKNELMKPSKLMRSYNASIHIRNVISDTGPWTMSKIINYQQNKCIIFRWRLHGILCEAWAQNWWHLEMKSLRDLPVSHWVLSVSFLLKHRKGKQMVILVGKGEFHFSALITSLLSGV